MTVGTVVAVGAGGLVGVGTAVGLSACAVELGVGWVDPAVGSEVGIGRGPAVDWGFAGDVAWPDVPGVMFGGVSVAGGTTAVNTMVVGVGTVVGAWRRLYRFVEGQVPRSPGPRLLRKGA
jgi:hypothetical protein